MKTFFYTFSLFSFLFLSNSCSKEEEESKQIPTPEPETQNTENAFTALQEGDTLSLTETLQLKNTEQVMELKLFLDDEELASLKQAPFEYPFQTTDYPDGKHLLKATIYYKDGQEESLELPVFLLNTLATLRIPEINLLGEESYLIASNKEGEVLGLTEVKGSGTYQLKAANNSFGSTISISLLDYWPPHDQGTPGMLDLRTITDIPLQSNASLYFYDAEPYFGTFGYISLKMEDIGEEAVYFTQENSTFGLHQIETPELEFTALADPSWLAFYKVGENNISYHLERVKAGETLSLSANEINKGFTIVQAENSSFENFKLQLVPDEKKYPNAFISFPSHFTEENFTLSPGSYIIPEDPDLAYLLTLEKSGSARNYNGLYYYGKDRPHTPAPFTVIQSASLSPVGTVQIETDIQEPTLMGLEMDYYSEEVEVYWYTVQAGSSKKVQLPLLSSLDTIPPFQRIPPFEKFTPFRAMAQDFSEYSSYEHIIEQGVFPDLIMYPSFDQQYQLTALHLDTGSERKSGKGAKQRKKSLLHQLKP